MCIRDSVTPQQVERSVFVVTDCPDFGTRQSPMVDFVAAPVDLDCYDGVHQIRTLHNYHRSWRPSVTLSGSIRIEQRFL